MDVAPHLGLLADAVTLKETFPCRKCVRLPLQVQLPQPQPPYSSSQSMVRLQQATQTLDADNLSRIINQVFRLNHSI
jgi:hypothetical protein